MEDKDIGKPLQYWQPITNKADLANLGKLGEEASECCKAIFRCIIQGVDGKDPETGKLNKEWLEDEIADFQALTWHVISRFGLDKGRIMRRALDKHDWKDSWLKKLAEEDKK